MNLCKNCKHWIHAGDIVYAECDMVLFYPTKEIRDSIYHIAYDSDFRGHQLVFGEDFGCNKFEDKTK